jgi:alpha-tubulin suppressor-like RCC1 family protein
MRLVPHASRPLAAAAAALLALAACSSDSTGSGGTPASIGAAANLPASAPVGTTTQVTVRVTDASAKPVKGATVTWTATGGGSAQPATSMTDASGLASTIWNLGTTAGPQTLTASVDAAHTITFNMTATPGAATAVVVQPDSAALTGLGDTTRFTVTAKDANGNVLPVTWNSLDPSVAVVNGSGFVQATGYGRGRIVASAGGKADTAVVNVSSGAVINLVGAGLRVGDLVQLTYSAHDARGNDLPATSATWTTSNPAVVTVSSTGAVHAEGPGDATVTATIGGASATVPIAVGGPLVVQRFSAGYNRTCATAADGHAYCWGVFPRPQPGVTGFDTVATGEQHACALKSGAAWCWGVGLVGQLGNGNNATSPVPVPVSGGRSYTALAAGRSHTCGISGGTAWCWGSNAAGQLGTGTTLTCSQYNYACSWTPVQVAGAHTFTALDAEGDATCGLTTTGEVYCWGGRFPSTPTQESGAINFNSITVGGAHLCGISAGNTLCWGKNDFGQLGTGDTTMRTSPAPVAGGHTFVRVDAGEWFTCALDAAGAAWCWGENQYGELGNGAAVAGYGVPSSVPVAVAGGHVFSRLSSGREHACALASDGLWCWGGNVGGELGIGSNDFKRTTPVRVIGQP